MLKCLAVYGTVKKNALKNKIRALEKKIGKAFLLCRLLYSTRKRVFFWCEASNLLFLKVTAKMYHLFSGWKTKQKDVDIILFSADMRKLFGRHRIVMQRYYYRETDSYKPCMASFWIPSHIIILYAIYRYMFICYIYIVHFVFQATLEFE